MRGHQNWGLGEINAHFGLEVRGFHVNERQWNI